MPEVVVLADKGLERAEPVGVAGLAGSTSMWKSRLRWARWRSNAGTSSGAGRRRRIWSMVRKPPSARSTA